VSKANNKGGAKEQNIYCCRGPAAWLSVQRASLNSPGSGTWGAPDSK